MNIKVTVGDSARVTADFLHDVITFTLSRLLKPEQVDQVSLHVILTDRIADLGDIQLDSCPRFRLRLNTGNTPMLSLVTLVHELVHLKQALEGRLSVRKLSGRVLWFWEGVCYGERPYDRPDHSLPWEVEANSIELGIARSFMVHYVTKMNVS